MATASFVQEGSAIDYTPVADVAPGEVVVQNDLVGVAKQPIKANELGALSVEGVFGFPKATGSGQSIDAGVEVFWDAVGEQVTTAPASGDKSLGKTTIAADEDDTTVRVRLKQ